MAGAQTREFAHGEVIYREGGPGGPAFEVKSGRVALSRAQEDGVAQTVRIAAAGDIFGQPDQPDQPGAPESGPRAETATAAGHVAVTPLNRKALLRAGRRAEAHARALRRKTGAAPSAGLRAFAPAFVLRLINAAWPRSRAPETAPARLDVRVCGLAGDEGPGQKRVISALEELDGVRVRPLAQRFQFDPDAGARAVYALDAQIRRAAGDCGADLVVWGERTDSDTPLKVRFTSRVRPDPASAGAFGPWDILPVRDGPDPALDALLRAAALAALVPADVHRRSLHGRAFQPVLRPALAVVNALPEILTQSELASAHIIFAHISATAGRSGGQGSDVARDLLELARESYLQGIKNMEPVSPPVIRAMAHKNLGSLMIGDNETVSLAVDHIEDALAGVEKTEMPWEWAALQDNLGTAIYKLETSREDSGAGALQKSLSAYRNAALVYTRDEAPAKWASLQTGIARVAQILGKQQRDPKLLERAVAACEQALLVRSRKRTPGLWASTQNNLGTALFLLAEMTGRDSALGYAAEAFRAALSVYHERGPARMVMTVERNLARVERRMHAAAERGSRLVDWTDIGGGPGPKRPARVRLPGAGVETRTGAAEEQSGFFSPYDLAPVPSSAPRGASAPVPESAPASAPESASAPDAGAETGASTGAGAGADGEAGANSSARARAGA